MVDYWANGNIVNTTIEDYIICNVITCYEVLRKCCEEVNVTYVYNALYDEGKIIIKKDPRYIFPIFASCTIRGCGRLTRFTLALSKRCV